MSGETPQPTYRDRNDHYVPTGLGTSDGRVVEVSKPRPDEPPRLAIAKLGDADELNRRHRWWWARIDQHGEPDGVGPDGALVENTEHWSHFVGHHVQVDVTLSTWNEREVNDWKGRDEVRKRGTWTLALNRHPVWEADFVDPFEALLSIRRTAQKLIDHPMFDPDTGFANIVGRPVWWERTPAVIERVLDGGRIAIRPDGLDRFPPPVWSEGDDDTYEREEIVDTLLSSHVWWWRDRA